MNYAIKNDVKHAVALKLSNSKKYNKYSKIYSFTTENIKGYFKYLDIKNKDILTVASSGDHAINCFLNGAKEVDTYDINKLSNYYSNLKLAAIKSLTYHEFIEYFMINKNTFRYEIFSKLKDNLDNNTYIFFDMLYRYFDYNGYLFRTSDIFNNLYDTEENKLSYNDYLEENNYLKLKSAIKQTKFTCTSIVSLNKYINKKYDMILLSNISDYIKPLFNENYLEKYKLFIENNLSRLLKPNGKIVLGYIYDYNFKNNGRSDIDNEEMRNKIFNSSHYQIYTFDSVLDDNKQDAVIIYRKDG